MIMNFDNVLYFTVFVCEIAICTGNIDSLISIKTSDHMVHAIEIRSINKAQGVELNMDVACDLFGHPISYIFHLVLLS